MYPREEGPARAVLTQSSRAIPDPLKDISSAAELRAARAGPLLAVPPRALVARRVTPARAISCEGDRIGTDGRPLSVRVAPRSSLRCTPATRGLPGPCSHSPRARYRIR